MPEDIFIGPLPAVYARPHQAHGLVVFAHGSGSGRHSPRNRQVAEALEAEGLATLRADLLTPTEADRDMVSAEYRFNLPLLAERVVAVSRWAKDQELPLGLFGASTGAAAALMAAAQHPDWFGAIVSRGGRVDMPGNTVLRQVISPVLLLVGEQDAPLLPLNEAASQHLAGPQQMVVIPRAGHLFEEVGAMEAVIAEASQWYTRYLVASPVRF